MDDAFFVRDGDRFVATEWTRGPWDPNAQHAGPPSALLARAFDLLDPVAEMRLARITLEVLRPVPIGPLTLEVRLVRPGKRVQYAEGALLDNDETVIRAAAWRIRTTEGSVPEAGLEDAPPPGPEGIEAYETWPDPSYFTAMEWRFPGRAFFEPGPAAAWMRMRLPLVAGEETRPVSRVLAAADSGNGISQVLPLGQYLFINTELSVHLVRMPAGEWVCVDAVTRVDAAGVGLAESTLWDTRGRIGGGRQSLLVAPR